MLEKRQKVEIILEHCGKRRIRTDEVEAFLMHEASVAKEIADIVDEVVRENELKTVSTITIELGEFSCIQEEMLRFAFRMVTEDTVMADAKLEFVICKAMARCEKCGTEFPITFTDKVCPCLLYTSDAADE